MPLLPSRGSLLSNLIPERGLTLLSADTGAEDSFVLVHAALSIAFALPVANRFPVSCWFLGPLLYFNGEMSHGRPRTLHPRECRRHWRRRSPDLAQGKLLFEGEHGLADFFLGLQ